MVIDSHALVWWLEDSPLLSDNARRHLEEAETRGVRFHVAGVTLWELYRKERLGRFKPRMSVRTWPGLFTGLSWLSLEPTPPGIWLGAAELDWDHRDPADRLIAATALRFKVPVLTKDRAFHDPGSPVEAVW